MEADGMSIEGTEGNFVQQKSQTPSHQRTQTQTHAEDDSDDDSNMELTAPESPQSRQELEASTSENQSSVSKTGKSPAVE